MTDVTSFDGTRLAIETWGPEGAPALVLVHGLGLSMESWGDVPRLLSAEHRVIAYDLRGHAQSGDARSGDYTMGAHARDLEAVLTAALDEGQRAVVVGNSLGGGIILAHAREHGVARLAGVVFAGSGGSGVTFWGFPARDLPDWARAALRSGWFTALRVTALVARRVRRVEGLADALVRRSAFPDGAPQAPVRQVRDSFLSSRPRALAGTTLASVSHDGTALAPDLSVPTLVVHGTEDPEVPGQELRELLEALPDAELVSLPGKGHVLALTDAETVAQQIRRWVRHVGLAERSEQRPV